MHRLYLKALCVFSAEEDTKTTPTSETADNEQTKTQSNGDTGESQSYIAMTLSFNKARENNPSQ